MVQDRLFAVSPDPPKYTPYPLLPRGKDEALAWFPSVLQEAAESGLIGTDLEFNKSGPTILGISSDTRAVAVPWTNALAQQVIAATVVSKANLVGHSTIGAEKQQYEKALGIKTPTAIYDCSMIAHHLVNADFTKMAGKEEGEEAGSLGLMGLWTVASLYTDLPNWKDCRKTQCEGPCPYHAVFDYCAVDSWASLVSFREQTRQMREFGIPHSFYRDRIDLTDICVRMEQNGLRVDREWVKKLDEQSQAFKDTLFPYEIVNGKIQFNEVNPKSGKQVLKYCQESGISLDATTKGDIAKALEVAARKDGISAKDTRELVKSLEVSRADLSNQTDFLFRLYQFKDSGKGSKSWFDDKYFGEDGLIHPRFNSTGASTGRLSSSRPNMQNLGVRGWAQELKKAIIPPEDCDFLESDFSQLELRVVLYLAGMDMAAIGADAFTWLAANSNGLFTKAAANLGMSERDVAKSISHGADYMEGLQVLSPSQLSDKKIKSEVEYGARVVYQRKYLPHLSRDWDYRGGIVSFTGANLAERLFGDRTLPNRKRALEIVEDVYFKSFFGIREWQMKVLAQAESGYVQSPVGRRLRLYGTAEDDAKMAVAFFGQGVGADHVQSVMLRFDRELDVIPALNVHDSLVFPIQKGWSNEQAKDFIGLMQEETKLLPGFSAPGKIKRGPNYGEIKQI